MLKISHSIVGGPYGRNPDKARDSTQPTAPSFSQRKTRFRELLAIATASVLAELRAQKLQQQNIAEVEATSFVYMTTSRLNSAAVEFILPPPSTPLSPLRATAKLFIPALPSSNGNPEVEIEKPQNKSQYQNLADFVVSSSPDPFLTRDTLALKAVDTVDDDDNISLLCLDSAISDDEGSPLDTPSHNSNMKVDDDFSDSKWITRNGRSHSFDSSDEFLLPALFFPVNTPCSVPSVPIKIQPSCSKGTEYLLSLLNWAPGVKDQLLQKWALIEQASRVGIKVCPSSSPDTIRLLGHLKWKTDNSTVMTERRKPGRLIQLVGKPRSKFSSRNP